MTHRSAYEAAVDWLYGIEVSRGWDLKLESVRMALDVLGNPERQYPVIHVAGTNGKGSVAAFAHSILVAGGLRAGLYTSPHLVDLTERIRVGERDIERADVVRILDDLRNRLGEARVELTFFEWMTVLAFAAFAEAEVDVAVVEVGLGGRLDATNVVEPRVTAITTLALEHERFLGDTVEAIAAEKAGIVKGGVPVVLGAVPEQASAVVAAIAKERRSPLFSLGRDFAMEAAPTGLTYHGLGIRLSGLRPGLAGRVQVDNAAVALAALEVGGWLAGIPPRTTAEGLANVRWPGRLEAVGTRPKVVLDGAHNPAALEALVHEIASIAGDRPVRLLFGCLGDRDLRRMARPFRDVVHDATIVSAQERRSASVADVMSVFEEIGPVRSAPSGREAIRTLLDEGRERDEIVLVTGSLFLVGEVRPWLVAATDGAAAGGWSVER